MPLLYAGMGVGLVDGGDRRRNSGDHRVGGQPVAGILQGEEGKQAVEQQAAMTSSGAFPVILLFRAKTIHVSIAWIGCCHHVNLEEECSSDF